MEGVIVFAYRCMAVCTLTVILTLLSKLRVSTTLKFILFGLVLLGLAHGSQVEVPEKILLSIGGGGRDVLTLLQLIKADLSAMHAWLGVIQERFIFFTLIFFTTRLLDTIKI